MPMYVGLYVCVIYTFLFIYMCFWINMVSMVDNSLRVTGVTPHNVDDI